MSQQINTAIRRVEHDLMMNRSRRNMGIPVDEAEDERLHKRRTALIAEREAEARTAMRATEIALALGKLTPAATGTLTPMGADETLHECERRVTFGHPEKRIPKWL